MTVIELPDIARRDSFLEGMREFAADGLFDGDLDALAAELEERIRLWHAWSRGEELKPGRVQSSEYWIFDGDRWAGRIAFRRTLTPALEQLGGHIGYGVRSSMRRRGIATRALALVLERVRDAGTHDRVLLTCDASNAASRRVIERNGGMLASDGDTRRYWIAI